MSGLGTVHPIAKNFPRSHISGQTLVSSQGRGVVHVEEIKVLLFLFCFALFFMALGVRMRPREQVNFRCGKHSGAKKASHALWKGTGVY